METVIRYQIADFLNVGGEDAENYVLMGVGFNTLDENPAAKIDKKAYINDRSASGTITGYENTFAFDTDLIADEQAVMALYDVSRDQKTGGDAQFDYIRTELFKPVADEENTYEARKFRVACEVTSVNGAGTEIVRVAGNLHQVGNLTLGQFNTTTKIFTPTAQV